MPREHSTHHLYSSHMFCKANINIPISQARKLRLRKINCWKSHALYILDWTVTRIPFCLVTKSVDPLDLARPRLLCGICRNAKSRPGPPRADKIPQI